jgi:uncharacterized protein (UPF0216 family)
VAPEFDERDKFVDAVFREELKRLNSHLPKKRKILEELLADHSSAVESISGHAIRMKKEELNELSRSLPSEALKRIRLPIVLLRRRDLGTGAFSVLGDPYEEYSIILLSGAFNGTFEDFKRQTHGTATIYKPQVSDLLRRFHSLILIGFGTTGLEQ